MSYTRIKKLPSAEDLIQSIPLSMKGHEQILKDRQTVNAILSGEDKRLLMIVGPCSAWPKEAVLEYAKRLQAFDKQVNHALKLVMRVYIQKPRTTKGWTGPVNQPDPFSSPDIEEGMKYTRDMMVKAVDMGLSIADEALFTHHARGFLELLSWVAIGARSSEDQEHRIFASLINCAVGLKNPTHGSLNVAVNSVIAAQHTHTAVLDGYEVQSHGNPYAHVVLRGSHAGPNYSSEHIKTLQQLMKKHHVKNPSVVIDVSHDNCIVNGQKNPLLQPAIIFDVMDYLQTSAELSAMVKGFMVESFLEQGNQKVDVMEPSCVNLNGLSITDPCLGWDDTEKMLLELARRVELERMT